MRKKNLRFALAASCALSIFGLSACNSISSPSPDLMQHNFTEGLSQPRPRSADKSYAMEKMHSEFSNFSPRVLGCLIDTAVWEDELSTFKGGFDPLEVYDATIGYNYTNDTQKAEEFSKVLNKYGTIPWVTRWGIENQGSDSDYVFQFLLNSSTFADMKYLVKLENNSVSGWSTEGVLFSGAILFLSALNDALAGIRERGTVKDFNLIHLSYRLTPEDEIELEKLGLSEIRSYKEAGEIGDFYARKILDALAKAAQKAGYSIAGDVVDYTENKAAAKMHIALEGKGCPKANPTKPWEGCEVSISHGRYKNGAPFHIRLGKAGSKTASIIYDATYEPRVILKGQTDEEIRKTGHRIAENIVKDNPNMTFYWPAVKRENTWEPQYVLDGKGRHYFVVPVKRGASNLNDVTSQKL